MSEVKPNTKIYEYPTLELAARGMKVDIFGELVHMGKIDHMTQLRLELALQEAIANSVEHGNLGLLSEWKNELGEDGIDKFSKEKRSRLTMPEFAQKRVKIAVSCAPDLVEVVIQDEGQGFDLTRHSTKDGLEPYGRGLAMIYASMDKVEFADGGRQIKMIKRFSHGAQV